jgi:hypothetical protein
MKLLISVTLLIFSKSLLSQNFDLQTYYSNFRKFESLYNQKQYKEALNCFMVNGIVWPFNDDKLAFYKCYDSALVTNQISKNKTQDSNYQIFRHKLKYTKEPKFMETGYMAIDGSVDFHKISSVDLKIDTNYSNDNSRYLINLISIDRFIGYSRFYLSTPITDSLFNFLGDITFEVLKKAKLPGREITSIWEHETFFGAMLHSLQGLRKYPEKQDSMLKMLKQHVILGNIEAGNYAAIYDRIYVENKNFKESYYGQGLFGEMKDGVPISKAYKIFDSKNVNSRRKELELIPIEEFYKKYNITYDFNID